MSKFNQKVFHVESRVKFQAKSVCVKSSVKFQVKNVCVTQKVPEVRTLGCYRGRIGDLKLGTQDQFTLLALHLIN